MKRAVYFAVYSLIITSNVFSQAIPDYYIRSSFLFAPPAAFEHGLIGFTNPANLALLPKAELRFQWSTDSTAAGSLENWGIFSALPHLGFSVQRQNVEGVGVTDYKFSTGFGSRGFALGFGYGWSAGKQDAMGREKLITAGAILRPAKFFSIGLVGNFSVESSNREGIGEIGIRPFGTPKLLLFADTAIQKGVDISDAPWSFGGAFQIAPGIYLLGRYFKSEMLTLGLTINFGKNGIGGQAHLQNSDYAQTTFLVRAGGNKASIFQEKLSRDKRYVPLEMKGRVDYLKYRYFDDNVQRLIEVLKNIQAATADPRVSVIALNLSGLRIRAEHTWEVREELKKARAEGKKVVIFIDRVAMTGYHLASIADKIVLDPQGAVRLQGYSLSRTYLKGTLEKLGLGFDEWRFFKYKSAAETFSRDSMSEAEREQRQAYIDDWYELTRSDVCDTRSFSTEKFDELIDEVSYFVPEKALEVGLVDTLARWSDIDAIVEDAAGAAKKPLDTQELLTNALPAEIWGTLPKIAVVYGLGVCDMDAGIRARFLEKVFLKLAKTKSVKAVVFRVDSPGGDGMASDVVAEALRKCSRDKPVIISLGQVAASGGYWISMYGDEIVAGPNTVTGSIGVIFGWVYDKGFGKKLGMTSDLVQRGRHADLGQGVRLPFTSLIVPARNLTPEERAKGEKIIREHYSDFVAKVAQGRNMTEQRVREIAEGRIYSGIAARELGLVDELGSLTTAISIARDKAGLKPEDDVKIIEIPEEKGLFGIGEQFSQVGAQFTDDPTIQFLRLMIEQNGTPSPILTPGSYPDFE